MHLNTRRFSRKSRGFNIVEILVALMLLSFGIYGAADVLTSSQKTGAMTGKRMTGDALARLKIEEIRAAVSSGSVAVTEKGLGFPADGTPVIFEQDPRYSWTVWIEPESSPAQVPTVRVSVTIRRTGSNDIVVNRRGIVALPVQGAKS